MNDVHRAVVALRHVESTQWRRIAGFVNLAVGSAGALLGLLLFTMWVALGLSSSPPSPAFSYLPIPFLAVCLIACFGLVAVSGVGLLRSSRWAFATAVTAWATALAVGCLASLAVSPSPPWPSTRADDIFATYLESAYRTAEILVASYWIYVFIAGPMLLLGRNRSRANGSEGLHT